MNENKNLKKGLGIHARRFIAYVVLILVTFACLFWFYVLFINATRSNGEPQAEFPPDAPIYVRIRTYILLGEDTQKIRLFSNFRHFYR